MYNRTCYQECPMEAKFYPLYKHSHHVDCYKKCPNGYNIFNETQCTRRCPKKAKYEINGTCVADCPGDSIFILPNVDCTYGCNDNDVCITECPANYLINGNECIKECPSSRKHVFNNTCNENCPIDHNYKQFEADHYKCLDQCPVTLLVHSFYCVYWCPADALYNVNRTCVAACPNEARYRYDNLTSIHVMQFGRNSNECMEECPTNFLVNGNECITKCPSDRKYVFNRTCLETCPIEHNYKQLQEGHYICIDECPATTFVHKKFYCVPSCPVDALYQVNKTCVATCPSEVRYKYSNLTTITVDWYSKKNIYHHYCLADCPAKTQYNQDACVEECPKDANFLFNRSCDADCPTTVEYRLSTGNHFTCLNECPSNTFVYNSSLCVWTCPTDKNYAHNGTCYQECPELDDFMYKDGSYFRCMNECNPFLTYNKTCLQHCPEKAKFRDNGECIAYCNDQKRIYTFRNFTVGPGGTKIYDHYCLDACPANMFIFNLTCVSQCSNDTLQLDNKCVKFCPKERPLNYTTTKGEYVCVHSCPHWTYRFENVCFNQCPLWLKYHQNTCTHKCPTSHPYTDIISQKCLSACENNFVITDNNICDKKCPTGKHYIEKNSCVFSCKNPHSLLQTTEQGLVCHDQCPHHLLLMENKGACVEKCPEDKLIVGNVCRALYKCPNHTYLEHTDFGRRCTNKCSSGLYLDGTQCVKKCPPEKVIYDAVCANECPTTHPLKYKEFGLSTPRLICYRQCPGDYVANGSVCIKKLICYSENHFSYEHKCFKTCPPFTAISNGYYCVSLKNYVIYFLVLLFLTAILMAIFYCLTCFTGMKPKTLKECKTPGIKTHFQLISKRTTKRTNEKYVIRYSIEDNEEAEIIEVNRQNTDHDGDEIVEISDGLEAPTTFRRRK